MGTTLRQQIGAKTAPQRPYLAIVVPFLCIKSLRIDIFVIWSNGAPKQAANTPNGPYLTCSSWMNPFQIILKLCRQLGTYNSYIVPKFQGNRKSFGGLGIWECRDMVPPTVESGRWRIPYSVSCESPCSPHKQNPKSAPSGTILVKRCKTVPKGSLNARFARWSKPWLSRGAFSGTEMWAILHFGLLEHLGPTLQLNFKQREK